MGDVAGNPLPTSENHRVEFGTLTMLVTLTTAINNSGSPILKVDSPAYHGALETSQPASDVVLNAVASILARNHEIIAVTGQSQTQVVAIHDDDDVTRNLEDIEDVDIVMDEGAADQDVTFPNPSSSTAVPNSRDDDPFDSFVRYDNPCTPVNDPLQSHWSSKCQGGWESLDICEDDPLRNHCTTVVEYLSSYQKLTEENKTNERNASFHNMMKYMVACSWQKMCRRMSQWQSKGFTHYLTSISDDVIESNSKCYISSMGAPKRMDSALVTPIIDLHNSITRDGLQIPGFSSLGLPKLAATCQRVWSSQREEQLRVYTEDTCVEFHRFFVAVLRGYRDALVKWRKICDAKRKTDNAVLGGGKTESSYVHTRLQCAMEVYDFGHLLWRIAYSQALRDHLGLLAANHQILLPTYGSYKRGFYRSSGGDDREAISQKARQEGDEEAQELQELMEQGDIVFVHLRWIQLQVTQWAALDVLSSYSRRVTRVLKDSQISISLLAMKRPHRGKMKDWRAMIRELISQHPPETDFLPGVPTHTVDAKKVIKIIEEKIKHHAGHGGHNIFRKFNGDGPMDLECHTHCDLAMACLLAYPERVLTTKSSAYGGVKKSNPGIIGMSTLTCPVCWELLVILRGNTSNFRVRGRHSCMSPVQLPPGLPEHVMEKMISQFRTYLLSEICTMVNKSTEGRQTRHNSTRSLESHSGLTVASYESGDNPKPNVWEAAVARTDQMTASI